MNRTFAIVALSVVAGVALALAYLSYGVLAVPVLFIGILAATRLDRPALAIGAQAIGIGATIAWLTLPWALRCAGAREGTVGCGVSSGGEAAFIIGVAIAALGAFVTARRATAS